MGRTRKMGRTSRTSISPKEELNILRSITNIMGSRLNLEDILREIIKLIVKVTKADSCLLYLFEEEKEELVLRASKNPRPEFLGRIKMKVGEGITGWVAKEKKPVIIPKNAADDPRFKFFQNLPEDRYHAFLSIPVLHRDEVIGVINIHHKKPHNYLPKEVAMCSMIAQHVSGVIEQAILYEQLISAKQALEARKIIERAKGILMREMGIQEDEAYKIIQKKSMDFGKPMKEIAEAIILANEIKGSEK